MIKRRLGDDFVTAISANLEVKATEVVRKNAKGDKRKPRGDRPDKKPREPKPEEKKAEEKAEEPKKEEAPKADAPKREGRRRGGREGQ
jgi:hypothetical protein